MIATLQGIVQEVAPLKAVIVAGGIGYEVNMPLVTAEKLPALGQTVLLYTHVVYREEAQTLYGFADQASRDFFKLIVDRVSGIGPKIALGLLSRLSLPVLQQAVVAGDVGMLAQCPGIGKKTAERLVIELRDKIPRFRNASPLSVHSCEATEGNIGQPSPHQDAVAALMALGYKSPEADKAIRRAIEQLDEPSITTERLIKCALSSQ